MSKFVTVAVYLKSGQTLRFRAEKVTTSKSRVTGELLEVRWENADHGAPLYVDLEQVAAITTEEA